MTKMLEEKEGVASSKRVMGTSSMIAGVAILCIAGIVSIFAKTEIPNISIAVNAGASLVGIGAGLLGVTVIESFSGNKS